MNITKILIIALIASASTLFTVWAAMDLRGTGWYFPLIVLSAAVVISHHTGHGSATEFLKKD